MRRAALPRADQQQDGDSLPLCKYSFWLLSLARVSVWLFQGFQGDRRPSRWKKSKPNHTLPTLNRRRLFCRTDALKFTSHIFPFHAESTAVSSEDQTDGPLRKFRRALCSTSWAISCDYGIRDASAALFTRWMLNTLPGNPNAAAVLEPSNTFNRSSRILCLSHILHTVFPVKGAASSSR